MKVNRMFRSSSSLVVSLGLPGAMIGLVVVGLQSASLVSQLAFSCAAVCLVFSVLIFLPYFFERHALVREAVFHADALQLAARIKAQRTQHFVLNRALLRHQLRGRGVLASVRAF